MNQPTNPDYPQGGVDLSALKAQMQTSAAAAIGWQMQPTIFPVNHEGIEGMVPCLELSFDLSNGSKSSTTAIPPDLIIGLISGLSTWLSQIQGNVTPETGNNPAPPEGPAMKPAKKKTAPKKKP